MVFWIFSYLTENTEYFLLWLSKIKLLVYLGKRSERRLRLYGFVFLIGECNYNCLNSKKAPIFFSSNAFQTSTKLALLKNKLTPLYHLLPAAIYGYWLSPYMATGCRHIWLLAVTIYGHWHAPNVVTGMNYVFQVIRCQNVIGRFQIWL